MMSRRFCTCWLLLVTVLLLLLGETYPWHLAVSRGRACWKSSVVGHVAISPQLSSTNRKQHIVNYLPSLRLVHSRHHGDNDISLTRLHDASASSDVLEATPQKPSTQKRPSMKDLLVFGLPTLGIWLLQPILSLIDTAVVGMSKYTSVAELAALGPGISWIDSTSYLFYFMGVATTSLFTTALREQQANPDAQNKPKEVLSNAISISIGFGVILAILQYSLASKSISMLSGSSISSIPYGIRYAQIRALAAPVALFTIVAQAAFLAVKDSMTPLYAVLLGAVVNIIGDVFLVSYCQQGVVGAAIATTCSQYAGALYLAYAAIRKILKSRAPSVSRRQALKHTIVLPKLKESMKFLEFCGPLFFILLTKSFLWTFTTYAASSAGVIDLAAHQIVINFFLFFCIFGDVLAQIAQTFIPYTFQSSPESTVTSKEAADVKSVDSSVPLTTNLWTEDGRHISKLITKLALILGVFNACTGYALSTVGSRYFTTAKDVIEKMKSTAPFLAMCALPHCTMLGCEGVIIVSQDLKFLSTIYFLTGSLFLLYQSLVRKTCGGTEAVWMGMVVFQWIRAFIFQRRLKHLTSSSTKTVKVNENSVFMKMWTTLFGKRGGNYVI